VHGNVIDAGDREVTVLLRLEQPALAVLGGVLSDDECQQLIELARPRLARSTVVDGAYREFAAGGLRSNCAKPL
jgi:prolyl 4-hydroxylase